ncbi:hypothetical protein WME90_14730 [Sorangium sp. So ce375]|uniref:hypothetical protein n=1 Tax=Sorangium sp. So ce375 TaxID=3133306 RepID=UPI003F5C81C2
MTFRSLLVAAGVLGSISVASAQTPPAPPPAPPADPTPLQPSERPTATTPAAPGAPAAAPGAPGAPAAAPGAPAAAPGVAAAPAAAPLAEPAPPAQPEPPAAPPPAAETPRPDAAASPVVQWNQATAADAVQEEDEETTLRWRGTTFTWNQAGSTTLFGVGGEHTPDMQVYGWDFTLRPSYYVLDRPKDKVSLSAEIGWLVELTNSDTTADYRETQLKDMALGAQYKRELWQSGGVDKGEYKTDAAMRLRVTLPTSPMSWNSGRYFTLAFGPQVTQKIKLLGSKADGLNSVTATLGVNYAHLFAGSYTAEGGSGRLRMAPSGEVALDYQLTGRSMATDRLTTSLAIDLPLYKDLSLATSFGLLSDFKHEFEGGCAYIETGCAPYEGSKGPTYIPQTAFDVSLSYPVYEVVDLALGYNNTNLQLGFNGERRNFFYSPDAQFYLDITANLDVIYSKVTGRGKKAEKAGIARASSRQEL